MKVEKTSKQRTARAAAGKARTSGPRVGGVINIQSAFRDKLTETQIDRIREELDTLLEKIDLQAKAIEKSLTFETIREYRELVRKFINVVVNDLFVVQDLSHVSSSGKKKPMLLVKKVDEVLDKMVSDFMGRQSNLLNFLNRMDEIRGMLVDLYN
jgi:uncharacterized protein